MYRIERTLLHHLAEFAKASERAADAYHLRFGVYFFEPFDFLQLFGEKFLYLSRLFRGRNSVVLEKFGERNRAERKGFVVKKVFSVILNDFCRTATDFENKPPWEYPSC